MQEVVGGRKIDENGWLNKLLIISPGGETGWNRQNAAGYTDVIWPDTVE